ncbi:G1 family glutamic endopeptidase [Cellulomonas sp. URHD0024]|uniref:G1 family glutamic endopeptidase n=1 Tax=Cellulomonas sp. URHD0024 TaxID=1302620 RepID=UPI00048403D2|nr:G1 family glutamic endopeptidase [Cellulomonas sp. URHD0024]
MSDESQASRTKVTAPPPQGFDPTTAGVKDLVRYRVPRRPDPQTDPGLTALWDRLARRYAGFEHLQTEVQPPTATGDAALAFGLEPTEDCGYELTSFGQPFTAHFVTWTVPNLRFVAGPQGGPVRFQTFVGLGFLDVHVEMSVDAAQNVTAAVTVQGGPSGLPVAPGEVLRASLCLDTSPPGRANIVLANETRGQTVNFSFDSGFPPAVTINAGVSRSALNVPFNPLAQFGIVYFDEISAYSTGGFRSLTSGNAVAMVDRNGKVIARPQRLTDFTFRAEHLG